MYKSFIFIFLAAISLASCTEDFFSQTIEIDPPAYDKQLVVHQLITNRDSSIHVEVGRNFGILENVPDSAWLVRGATVEIWLDGQKYLTFQQSNLGLPWHWAYNTIGLFQPGKEYEIKVQHPDFEEVTAKQTMQENVAVDSVRFRENGGILPGGDKVSAIEVFLKDVAGAKNYYMVQVISKQYNGYIQDSLGNWVIDSTQFYFYPLYPETSDDPNARFGAYNSMVVNDQFFDGSDYRFSFKFYKYSSQDENFRVVVRGITEEYYRFLITAIQKADAEESPFADPVTDFGNLKNGIGYFALASEQVFEVF